MYLLSILLNIYSEFIFCEVLEGLQSLLLEGNIKCINNFIYAIHAVIFTNNIINL